VVAAKVLTFSNVMAKKKNHFTLFDIPAAFDLNIAELTSRYLSLQKVVHPDKFANASEQEKLHSVQQAAQLNDAYDTLKKPLLRARYLLSLNNVHLDDDDNTAMDASFLMQQMELHDAIDAAKKQTDIDALNVVIDDIDDLYDAMLRNINDKFSKAAPAFDQIAGLVKQMQFFNRLREQTDSLALTIENNKE